MAEVMIREYCGRVGADIAEQLRRRVPDVPPNPARNHRHRPSKTHASPKNSSTASSKSLVIKFGA